MHNNPNPQHSRETRRIVKANCGGDEDLPFMFENYKQSTLDRISSKLCLFHSAEGIKTHSGLMS